ncbi:hypothetical protein LRS56_13070 [Pseudomonas poae]|nr:hypothetical protein LRS56_13070 [Pseudomonas poae]
MRLDNSTASINNSTLINSAGVGLQSFGSLGATTGSNATVSNSTVGGAIGGAEATNGSELHFTNTRVMGLGTGSFGVSLQGATATATQSTIIGQNNGVSFVRGRLDARDGKLVLDQTSVEGQTGSAISVRGGANGGPTVNIDVLNHSTLTGGNGNLLSVTGGGSASMNVDDSRLTGNVIADGTSTAHLSLQNNAMLTGQLQNVSSLNVGNASSWR